MSTVPSPAWSLLGVIIGYCLGEGTRFARENLRIRRLKRVLHIELSAIKAQIADKEDILLQAIQSLKVGEVLPAIAVHSIRTGYEAHMGELYEHYSGRERNCLHVIYERLRVADRMMDSFHLDFQDSVKNGIVQRPWDMAVEQLEELLESYSVVEKLIESFLIGEPSDVFHIEK